MDYCHVITVTLTATMTTTAECVWAILATTQSSHTIFTLVDCKRERATGEKEHYIPLPEE